jgi:hypothetical protein
MTYVKNYALIFGLVILAMLASFIAGSRATAMQVTINIATQCTVVTGNSQCTGGSTDRSPQTGGEAVPPAALPPAAAKVPAARLPLYAPVHGKAERGCKPG